MKFLASHRLWITLLGAALFAASYLPLGDALESRLYHWLIRAVPETPVESQVSVIALDESAFVDFGPWPWGSQRLTDLVDMLAEAGATAIGLAVPVNQSQQARTLLQQDRVVLAWPATEAEERRGLLALRNESAHLVAEQAAAEQPWFAPLLLPPHLPWQLQSSPLARFDVARVGVLALKAENEPVRAEPLMLDINGVYRPSFALDLLARARGVPVNAAVIMPGLVGQTGVRLGDAFFATDAALRVYPRPLPEDFPLPVFSVEHLLEGRVPAANLRGKIVLLGITAPHLSYHVAAPGGWHVTPVQWQAQVVNALLTGDLVRVPGWAQGVERAGLLLFLLYFLLLPRRLRGRGGLLLGAVLALLTINVSLLGLVVENLWLPLGLPALYLLTGQVLLAVHHRVASRMAMLQKQVVAVNLTLAAELRNQGKLDPAFDTLRSLPPGTALDALYELGQEYERRRQFGKALAVYEQIAEQQPKFRDIAERREKHRVAAPAPLAAAANMGGNLNATSIVSATEIERPLLGRYEIENELGRGAMGTVYLGRDPRIGRTVAIKTLPLSDEFDGGQLDEVRQRFFQEAETAGRLSHRDIVTIYDVGEEHDLAYIAMDYIAGDSLDNFVHRDDLLPIATVFEIGIRVAEALDYAHTQKVVHRDVKPGNILFDAEKDQLKVTDFGIACLTDHSKTRTGTVLGSPFYMSPEQLTGKRVDGRSDLFSLGVTLYQLWCGQLPFQGENLTTLMYRIANDKPKPIRKLRVELPACLTRVINRALEKDPARRYASGKAMAEALRRCVERAGALK